MEGIVASFPQAVSGHARVPLHVLVVDDFEGNRILASAQLLSLGAVPYTASSGQTAVLMHQTLGFDVILMDLEMPDLDGIAATAQIREVDQTRPARPRAAVVAYTASEITDQVLLRDIGMDDVLRKPCAIEAMASCMERCRSRLRAANASRSRGATAPLA